MTNDELARQYPKLHHMSEAGSWPSIQKHGLLSTTALLDLYEITGPKRTQIESQVRPKSVCIEHPEYGIAVVRDQAALCDKPRKNIYLKNCLDGVTPAEWCKFLNRKTYFWPDFKPLGWMLNSYMYRDRAHWIIIVDTRILLNRHSNDVTISNTNSGSIWNGKRRGIDVFQPMKDYRNRYASELAVDYSVPDIAKLATSVEEWKGNAKIRTIWSA